MNSRYLIATLCLGAVVFACGPRSRNEAVASTGGTTTQLASASISPIRAHRAPARAGSVDVSGHLYVHTAPSAVRVALHVVNEGSKRVELRFPSGQTYDFVILDSLGRRVWNWSTGRMFTQGLRNRMLSSGETIVLEETWDAGRLAPGRYVARGLLTSDNYPLREEVEFTVGNGRVAQKD